VGLVCNQATLASDYRHILDHLLPGHQRGEFNLAAIFGPQHGIWGHTQDNMIEWEGYRDPKTELLFHSLYGEVREPTDAMMAGIEHLVIDLPDIGTRYYTFAWTMALCLKAATKLGIPVTILDRPNPLNGVQIEGPMLDPSLASFVGLYPVPTRHGLSLGEMARYLAASEFPSADVRVIECQGWDPCDAFEQTGLTWAMPSPNMPTPDTALVYPGMCLLEATNVSEGRGTTRPFEMFGAPWIDAVEFCQRLNALHLPGVSFRSVQFEPTFHKFAKEVCQGAFIHVTDRAVFKPVLMGVAILQQLFHGYAGKFAWKEPPYEYVWDRDPIDILLGQYWLREAIEQGTDLGWIEAKMDAEAQEFWDRPELKSSLIYER